MPKVVLVLLACILGVIASAAILHKPTQPTDKGITVSEARSLPPRELAEKLLGGELAARVIEAVRREYSTGIPQEVEFYTKPELTWPRINRICRTDVITVEYNWYEHDIATAATRLRINRVSASSRFKAFPMPPGKPGSPENERAQAAACASFTTAIDAFRAPDAGDAQWLSVMELEYSKPSPEVAFPFTCSDYADKSCHQARQAPLHVQLKQATDVSLVPCSRRERGDQMNECYRLTFPYPKTTDPEWVLTMMAGIENGSSPVRIRSAHLEHVEKPKVMY